MATSKLTLVEIAAQADQIFHRLRWPNGIVCPVCGSIHIYNYKDGSYRCADCKHHFTDKSSTIFQKSKLSIAQWMIILYLMLDGRGMSSIEIARKVGITQATAWLACSKLRFMFSQDDVKLTGNIAMDEVYLGGSWANFPTYKKIQLLQAYGLWQKDRKDNYTKKKIKKAISIYKQPVYGMNDGKHIVLQALPNNFVSKNLSDSFQEHVTGISTVVSDQSSLYQDWEAKTGCPIETNNHSERVYKTRSGLTSNRIEGTFSHLKRRDKFVYVHYNKEHTQLYLNEMTFIWNHRTDDLMTKFKAAFKLIETTTTRKQLISYDERNRWNVDEIRFKKRMTVDEALDIMETVTMIRTLEVNGIEYSIDDLRNMIFQGIKYLP